jgi:phosphoribosylformylglycinamidine synthase subunit PurS
MNTFLAHIDIMPHAQILDPQGKAITSSLKNLGLPEIENIRVGKHITLEIKAENEKNAHEKVEEACRLLLANLIMEQYTFTIKPLYL